MKSTDKKIRIRVSELRQLVRDAVSDITEDKEKTVKTGPAHRPAVTRPVDAKGNPIFLPQPNVDMFSKMHKDRDQSDDPEKMYESDDEEDPMIYGDPEIPFLAQSWHSGQGDPLYALGSGWPQKASTVARALSVVDRMMSKELSKDDLENSWATTSYDDLKMLSDMLGSALREKSTKPLDESQQLTNEFKDYSVDFEENFNDKKYQEMARQIHDAWSERGVDVDWAKVVDLYTRNRSKNLAVDIDKTKLYEKVLNLIEAEHSNYDSKD